MSWDVLILALNTSPFENEPADLQPVLMGDAEEVRVQISRSFPSVDWSDPAWGELVEEAYVIEFNFVRAGPVDHFTLHVRGGGDPVRAVTRLCQEHGWYAYDCSTGEFLDLQSSSGEGWEAFKEWRDHALRDEDAPGAQEE
jgi:hypothetical protein